LQKEPENLRGMTESEGGYRPDRESGRLSGIRFRPRRAIRNPAIFNEKSGHGGEE